MFFFSHLLISSPMIETRVNILLKTSVHKMPDLREPLAILEHYAPELPSKNFRSPDFKALKL